MEIRVNGESVNIDKPSVTVEELLFLRNVEAPERVSVQLNQKFVNRQVYGSTLVNDKDEVEFLYFLGGGLR